MHGGGKLMVKDLQSHESNVAFVLYFVCTGTPHKYILRTFCSRAASGRYNDHKGGRRRTSQHHHPREFIQGLGTAPEVGRDQRFRQAALARQRKQEGSPRRGKTRGYAGAERPGPIG